MLRIVRESGLVIRKTVRGALRRHECFDKVPSHENQPSRIPWNGDGKVLRKDDGRKPNHHGFLILARHIAHGGGEFVHGSVALDIFEDREHPVCTHAGVVEYYIDRDPPAAGIAPDSSAMLGAG